GNGGGNDGRDLEACGRLRRARRAGRLRLRRPGASGRDLEDRRTQTAFDLDLDGHRPGDLMTDLADLAMVLHLPGRLLEANLEEPPALLAQVIVELDHGHPAQLVERISLLGHGVTASRSEPVSSRMRNRVLMGSLNAARRIASWAVSRVTPAISKSTRPGSTTATQP